MREQRAMTMPGLWGLGWVKLAGYDVGYMLLLVLLVGGLGHDFMTFQILGMIIPIDELLFFRGVESTNQLITDTLW